MTKRFLNFIGPNTTRRRVHHYLGKPSILTDGVEEPQLLPWARIVILEEQIEGAFLFRYTVDGLYAGDTWHQSIEEAQAQAVFEYQDALGLWIPVPTEVVDVIPFAQSLNSDVET